ncbi:MAG: putative 4-amino-4-deoxy-L-arabinose-phosphoundecaprenol flippase subunit ArnF [Candidatus Erwinia impunctatus]|nr:putative 4-amino-4-deoxy-L-arabinose-phosphoundecaprenol flippase subunit ArnF [Culicoides impunctatus]
MKGVLLALCSVLLVSVAQLLMRWSMIQLPAAFEPGVFLLAIFSFSAAVKGLMAGLLCYALSMLCWLLALRHTPLSKLYPLLSLSYLLVWVAALYFPAPGEMVTPGKVIGGSLILLGVSFVCWPDKMKSNQS